MDATNKNQTLRIVATILIIVGVALLAYSAYTYTTMNDILPAAETAAEDTTTGGLVTGENRAFTLPLIAGLLSLAIGAALLFVRPDTYTDTTGNLTGTGTPRRVP